MADQKPTEQANGKPSRGRRWWRRIWRSVLVLALVVSVAAVVYVMWVNAAGRRDAQRVLEAMQQRGLPTSYQALLATLPAIQPGEDGTRFYKAAMALAVIPEDEARGIPFISVRDEADPQRGEAVGDALAARLHTFVERHGAFYNASDKALRYRCARYGVRPAHGLAEMNTDALSDVRRVARMLEVRCLERTAAGDADGAVALMHDVLGWSRSMGRDPAVITNLTRVSLIATASSNIEQILSRVEPSAESLRVFRQALHDECDAMRNPIALRGDLALYAEALKYPKLASAQSIAYREHYIATDPYADLRNALREVLDANTEADDDEASIKFADRLTCDVFRIWSTVCPGIYMSASAQVMDVQLGAYDAWTADPDAYVQTSIDHKSMRADVLAGVVYSLTYATVLRAVVAAALDVEMYRIAHGRWPESLDVLPSGAANDPYCGEPLRYKRTSDGAIVYSVGQNRRDDGGEQDDIFISEGDFAFRLFDPEVRGTIQPTVEEADDGWGFNE